MPTAVLGGAKAKAVVRVREGGVVGGTSGPVEVQLYLSADGTLDAGDTLLAKATKKLRLKPGKTADFKMGFQFPATAADGDYHLLSVVDAGNAVAEGDETNNVAASAAVRVAKPFVDLVPAAIGAPPAGGPTILAGRKGTAVVTLTNAGNVPLKGRLAIALSAVPTAGGEPLSIGTVAVKAAIKPGQAKRLKLKFLPPATLPAGSYVLRAAVDPDNLFADPTVANNTFDTGVTIQAGA